MNCEVCSIGRYEKRLIRYCLTVGDKIVLADHAPAWVCGRCGETTLEPHVAARLQDIVGSSGKPSKFIETPVYEFA